MPYEKVGKSVPVCISDEVPFEIPNSWEWARLSTISSVVTKGTTPRGGNVAYLDSGIGFLRAENVAGFDYLDTSNMNYIDEATHNGYLKRSILEPNDILITIAGTLGRTAIVKNDNLPLNANQAVSIVRLTDATKVDLYFILCALNSPVIQKRLTVQKKITAIPNLTLEIISDCIIPIPPLAEQHRIVEAYQQFIPFFSDYEKTENQLQNLNLEFPDKLKKSILQQAVMGKLVPQDPNDESASVLLERIRAEKQALIKAGKIKKDKYESIIYRRDNSHYEKINDQELCIDEEIPFDIPDTWVWARLGTVSTYAETKKKINAKDADPSLWGLDLEDIEKGGRLLIKHTVGERKAIGDKTFFEAGDILYSKLRPYLLKVLVADEDGICTPEIVPFKMFGSIEPSYIVAYLKSPYVDDTINAATYGIKMPRAGTETMTGLLVPIPPIAEQQRILEQIKRAFAFVSAL